MAIVTMANAESGKPASSAEYNKVTANVRDLDTRATTLDGRVTTVETRTTNATSGNTALDGRVSTVESRTTNATTGNAALGTRVSALEAGSGGGGGGASTLAGRLVSTNGFINSGIAATEVNIGKLAITGVPTTLNMFYTLNVNLFWNFSAVSAGDSYLVIVRKDTPLTGSLIAEWVMRPVDASLYDDSETFSQPWKATATNASTNFYVSVQRIAGTGNISVNGDRRSAFWIDIKAASGSAWTEVA